MKSVLSQLLSKVIVSHICSSMCSPCCWATHSTRQRHRSMARATKRRVAVLLQDTR